MISKLQILISRKNLDFKSRNFGFKNRSLDFKNISFDWNKIYQFWFLKNLNFKNYGNFDFKSRSFDHKNFEFLCAIPESRWFVHLPEFEDESGLLNMPNFFKIMVLVLIQQYVTYGMFSAEKVKKLRSTSQKDGRYNNSAQSFNTKVCCISFIWDTGINKGFKQQFVVDWKSLNQKFKKSRPIN